MIKFYDNYVIYKIKININFTTKKPYVKIPKFPKIKIKITKSITRDQKQKLPSKIKNNFSSWNLDFPKKKKKRNINNY